MALPLLLIFHAGRIVQISVGIGTAIARFVAKNPKIIAEITANPNISIPEIISKHPKIIKKIMESI